MNHLFQKGNKIGAAGRPKGSGAEPKARALCEAHGWDQLAKWMRGEGAAANDSWLQFAAVKMAFAYGYGRPREQLKIEAEAKDIISLIKQAQSVPTAAEPVYEEPARPEVQH